MTFQAKGPRAAATARRAEFVPLRKRTTPNSPKPPETANAKFRRTPVHVIGPNGPFMATGQVGKALRALLAAGKRGVTALEVNSWAYRLGAYVHTLRKAHGLAIETQREPHEGGWHGRYVLHSTVTLADSVPDITGGKQASAGQPERRAA